ncbi:MAG: histidine kinase dimerization/phosphoacceptor domain -containing protein [Crocinitomicaceae bacterium]
MEKSDKIADLHKEIESLKAENKKLKDQLNFSSIAKTVIVPDDFKDIFLEAERNVRSYFSETNKIAENGEITISGERYILIRSAALSFEFIDALREMYGNRSKEEAHRIGQNFLFDIAHVLGKEDAKAFHKKMKLKDPVQKLSAGPVHFAFTGWANVEILPESSPTPDNDYFIKYHHHNSFEAQSWIKAKRKANFPVCIMNSGYSSGWCEESFGIPLTAVEIECEAHGDEHCTFIMAPPDRIHEYLKEEKTYQDPDDYDVPVFFQRKYNEEKLNASLKQKETLLQEVHHRVKNNLQIISSLLNLQKRGIKDRQLAKEFDTSIARVNTMAVVQEMIYSSKDVSSINIQDYFEKLVHSLYQIYETSSSKIDFDVEINIKNVIFDPDIAIPLGLIINEISCNSFKHAFDGKGTFYLNLKEKNGKFELVAGDNGKGISEEDEKDSLGMSLIEILCEQIDADLKVKNSKKGLEYKISFSI